MANLPPSHNLHSSIIPHDLDMPSSGGLSDMAADKEESKIQMESTQLSETLSKDETGYNEDRTHVTKSKHAVGHHRHNQLLHDVDGMLVDFGKSSTRGTPEQDDTWLQWCREQQVTLYGQMDHAKDRMGIWELDLLHHQHECYNAFLFSTLQPSSVEEQNSPARVFGYGTVNLKVRYDKASTTWTPMTLHNVKYLQASPYDHNHRVGLAALPKMTNIHFPKPTVSDDQGDGFLSIDNEIGCALGRVEQGSRKIWTLRTLDIEHISRDVQHTTKGGFLSGWFSGSGSEHRPVKRQRVDDAEVRACSPPRNWH